MSNSTTALRDVKDSLGLLNNVNQLVAGTNITLSPTNGIGVVTVNAPATLPSGRVLGGSWTSVGAGLSLQNIPVTGLTATSVVQVTIQQLDPTDMAGGVVIYSAQPTASGGGNISVTAKTPTLPAGLALAWQVIAF